MKIVGFGIKGRNSVINHNLHVIKKKFNRLYSYLFPNDKIRALGPDKKENLDLIKERTD